MPEFFAFMITVNNNDIVKIMIIIMISIMPIISIMIISMILIMILIIILIKIIIIYIIINTEYIKYKLLMLKMEFVDHI